MFLGDKLFLLFTGLDIYSPPKLWERGEEFPQTSPQ